MNRTAGRLRRHRRIRKRVSGYAARPRMAVFRSHKHLVVQLIDDMSNTTLVGGSTLSAPVKAVEPKGGNIAAAKQLGRVIAAEALKRGIQRVVFDRGGYPYHGRVKALADSAREEGLQF